MAKNFKKELEALINRHSKENDSNTPDFILAEFLNETLEAFNSSVKRRHQWYGYDEKLKENTQLNRELVMHLHVAVTIIRDIYGAYGINGNVLYVKDFTEKAHDIKTFLDKMSSLGYDETGLNVISKQLNQ